MSKLTPAQRALAQSLANTRAEIIAEILALDGVPVDAVSAAALMTLSAWNWEKSGRSRQEIARLFRGYADNIEAGKQIK